MGSNLDPQVLETLIYFEAAKITLVEWETRLLSRLGYPLAPKKDVIFLIPDCQLEKANKIAQKKGLPAPGFENLPPSYLSEFANRGSRYVFGNPIKKLILVPFSWTGIEQDELEIAPTPDNRSSGLPCTIWTVPLPAFCAAYLRIIAQESAASRARLIAIADLASVIAYSMFDMTYEGSYMRTPADEELDEAVGTLEHDEVETAHKDAMEMKAALETIATWHFKTDEQQIKDTLTKLVSGKLKYEQLPSDETRSESLYDVKKI